MQLISNASDLVFRQDENDRHFKIFVTADITSDNRISGAGLDRLIRQELEAYRKIGEYTVDLDSHYNFRTTEGIHCVNKIIFSLSNTYLLPR